MNNPWITQNTAIKYSNNWIDLKHNEIINPAGKDGIYGVVHFKNIAAVIVPIDNEGFTYLVGQFRYSLNEYSWELPMGGSPLFGNPLDGAKRELTEETGLIAETWTEIAKIHTSNSVTDEVGYIYLAENLIQKDAFPEETEQLEIRRIPFINAIEMAMNGEITDSLSVIGILKTARLKGI
jgi:8-oxo-dGTP pyrophosphatase MutT (NUDIX family)